MPGYELKLSNLSLNKCLIKCEDTDNCAGFVYGTESGKDNNGRVSNDEFQHCAP